MKIRFRGARAGRGAAAAEGSAEPRSSGARGAGGAGAGGAAVPGAPGAAGPALPLLGTDGQTEGGQTDRQTRGCACLCGGGGRVPAQPFRGTAPRALPAEGTGERLRVPEEELGATGGAPAPPPLPAKLLQVGAVALSASPHGFAFLSLSLPGEIVCSAGPARPHRR